MQGTSGKNFENFRKFVIFIQKVNIKTVYNGKTH